MDDATGDIGPALEPEIVASSPACAKYMPSVRGGNLVEHLIREPVHKSYALQANGVTRGSGLG